ncbi:hypothetical protein [Dyella mobilis]|uniref:SH3 domain-containing protein n=1 Tax=Dyella mobilis TaxID=1849582 RepID=A0ABS2KEN5_9GAMM|nr:hypothetical protein [Dyella mobilis]MBM7129631.1 hypothetical protein [Dyella mobilis]GLQ98103.1 hypothetical protein GCM10007863_25230 [Dyella mobilis]
MAWMVRLAVVLLLIVSGALPRVVLAADSNDCASQSQFAPPGTLHITKAKIAGAATERVSLYGQVPAAGADNTTSGYVLGGDAVDHVYDCGDYAYVRFHGKTRTTTGWVSRNRVTLLGTPYVPLPEGAEALCAGVQDAVNAKHAAGWTNLDVLPSSQIPEGGFNVDADPELSQGNGTVPSFTPFDIGNRHVAAIDYSDGGTCPSESIYIWSGDLKRRLSPADVVSRDPVRLHYGGEDWAMDLGEHIVSIKGRPMMLSSGTGGDFELSAIDETGDMQLVCHGRDVALRKQTVISGSDTALCDAVAAHSLKPIAMQAVTPANGKALLRTDQIKDVPGHFTLSQTGMADLDNSGTKRPVGIVTHQWDFGGGCGSDATLQLPVLLDQAGRADPSGKTFQADYKSLLGEPGDIQWGSRTRSIRLIEFQGATYVEVVNLDLTDAKNVADAPVESVWKLTRTDAKQMCTLQTHHYVVSTPSNQEKELSY